MLTPSRDDPTSPRTGARPAFSRHRASAPSAAPRGARASSSTIRARTTSPTSWSPALQGEGCDCRFETGFFFRERACRRASFAPCRARSARARQRELQAPPHPEVDVARVWLRPFPSCAMSRPTGWGSAPSAWPASSAGATTARRARSRAQVRREPPAAVIGHDGSALLAGRAAREVGALAVLNQVVGHVESALEHLPRGGAAAPAFAEAVTDRPPRSSRATAPRSPRRTRILVPSDYVRDTLIARGADPAKHRRPALRRRRRALPAGAASPARARLAPAVRRPYLSAAQGHPLPARGGAAPRAARRRARPGRHADRARGGVRALSRDCSATCAHVPFHEVARPVPATPTSSSIPRCTRARPSRLTRRWRAACR